MTHYVIRHSGYKRTTDKQYSLLTHEMARFSVEHRSGRNGDSIKFWNILTEKLNALGPPYRTVQQWKKVWTDFRRFHTKRNFKSTPKFKKQNKGEHDQDNEIFRLDVEGEVEEEEEETSQSDNKPATSSKTSQFLHNEWEDYEQNSHSTNSNDYADEYSYPDRHSSIQQSQPETLIPDESPYDDSYSYTPPSGLMARTSRISPSIANHSLPPPLQPPNTRLLDQTLYTLQNQLEHQTKLLEHLSQISSTMAGLMERQVNAVEKQTESMRRQASATEHHTLVMNNFVDMIRDKMPKANAKTNVSNGNL